MGLLNSMVEEATMGLRTLNIQEGFATSVKVSSLKTQLNLANMLLDLPAVIKEIEDRDERVENKIAQMQKAQESGGI